MSLVVKQLYRHDLVVTGADIIRTESRPEFILLVDCNPRPPIICIREKGPSSAADNDGANSLPVGSKIHGEIWT